MFWRTIRRYSSSAQFGVIRERSLFTFTRKQRDFMGIYRVWTPPSLSYPGRYLHRELHPFFPKSSQPDQKSLILTPRCNAWGLLFPKNPISPTKRLTKSTTSCILKTDSASYRKKISLKRQCIVRCARQSGIEAGSSAEPDPSPPPRPHLGGYFYPYYNKVS